MEQVAIKDLKSSAAKALSEVRHMEHAVERQRNIRVPTPHVPPFHTPLGVERGTLDPHAALTHNGRSVIAGIFREPGQALLHPWRDRTVSSALGSGRLIWTDGYRAAVSTSPSGIVLVDLESVYLQGG